MKICLNFLHFQKPKAKSINFKIKHSCIPDQLNKAMCLMALQHIHIYNSNSYHRHMSQPTI